MAQETDLVYYLRREADARQLANGSSDNAIKCIHNSMADRYAAKVHEMTAKPLSIV